MSDSQKNIREKVSIGLYRYVLNGRYFARVRYRGKLYRKSLETDDSALAKRRLADFRRTLERTDAASGKKSFAAVLDDYSKTLIGAPSTVEDKRVKLLLNVTEQSKRTFFF
jgi:hypothetical protein